MRISFVDIICDPARPGATGLSDVVWDMAGRLARLGEDVHVVAPYRASTFPDPAVQVHTFPLPPINYRNIAGHLLLALSAYRRLRGLGQLDVVHVPEYLTAAVLGTLLKDTPVVLTEPGNIYQRVARGNPYDPVTTLVYKLAARRAAATCARLIATSDEMAWWWQRTGFRPERISRVSLGIDTALFARLPDARAALGWPADPPVLLFAARLSRENGLDITLRALARLREQGTPAQLHVLGDGPERGSLEALASALGIGDQVTWHGWVDLKELPRYYSAADIFVFSGLSGGSPRVVLQAMGCGAPVVGSAIGGIVDHVDHGRTGLLFAPGSSRELAEQLGRLLVDPHLGERLGQAAAAYARQNVDWDRLVEQVRDVYRTVVRGKEVQAPAGGQAH
ncbi:MAG: glycosyltransferase family 4 protein [Chloroflexi bacterium]|nr:glycosyltransferase family 4 protein [Chloroflexota bacterium]